MLFSSITFLYYFLPCVLIFYLISPKKLRNTVLLISSLVFYAWGEPGYVLLMAAGIMNGYISGMLTEKFRGRAASKAVLAVSSAVSIGMLAYFKYADFFIENFNAATGLSVPLLKIALPVGISFYTFQILSYVIDVYRGEAKAQRNPINLACYVSLFPQLIAGPIVRYSDIAQQLEQRTHTSEKTAEGIRRFILGLAKKVLIANALGELCGIYSESDEKSIVFSWMYAAAYSLQVYFDFSGYSDMAIGLGKLFGFDFMENFNYPYISKSITEFWRRWHISLGTWFRDYVYIPLGGNRVSKLRWLGNIFVVWLLTGFWHGAAWNFIIWGLYFAVFLVIEKLFLLEYLKKSKILSHIYVLFAVIISFVIFGASDINSAAECIRDMLGFGDIPLISAEQSYYLRSFGIILIIAVIGATEFPKKLVSGFEKTRYGKTVTAIAEPVFLGMLLLVSTAYLVDGSFNPFLYFRF